MFVILLCFAFPRVAALSAVVNNNVFLQGTRVALGISELGSFGTSRNAPMGFEFSTSNPRKLGFVFDNDTFGVGSGRIGDYFLPGSAEERFSVGVNGNRFFSNCPLHFSVNPIPRVSVEDFSTASLLKASWTGQNSFVRVEQVVRFLVSGAVVKVEVTITNIQATGTLTDVRYLRNVDPDNEFEQTGQFATEQKILSNFDAIPGVAAVQGRGLAFNSLLILMSRDPRALATYGGFDQVNPYTDIPPTRPTGVTNVDDEAIQISARLGDLLPGASTTFTFFIGFNENTGASAVGDPHLVGAHGIKFDVFGAPGANYSLLVAPAFEVNMQLAKRGPELRFMTAMAVLYRGKSFTITPWTAKAKRAELIAHFESFGSKVSIKDDRIITIELCTGHTVSFATLHIERNIYMNFRMEVPGCHDSYGGLLGQTYQCKYATEKFEWSRNREDEFRVATLDTASGSYSPTVSCANEDEYRGEPISSGSFADDTDALSMS
jgi:hypothetical protein